MASDATSKDLEEIWENLLSREVKRVKEAFSTLARNEQESVLEHLKRMSDGPGWHDEQRLSARFALDAVNDI